ncbi:MAG: winged helix-turn-helix domain-containing protein [Bacteroidota bacterium]
MLPLLKMLSNEQEHSLQETDDFLSDQFYLTEDERRELLPSGQQPVFRNRLGWARTYMKKAGLLSTPRRAHFKITQRGLELLHENPSEITSQLLTRYQEFVDFKSIKKTKDNGDSSEKIIMT